jgi:adenylylsulfate kinase
MAEKLHIIQHEYNIDHAAREILMGHRSSCLWFTGLSGSGKSTISNKVEEELYKQGYKTYSLDGDNIRKGLNKDLSFTEEDRAENIRRIGEVASLMCDAGLIVLAAFVSPLQKDRQMIRDALKGNFFEIFVDTPIEVCEQRDVKGLYKKARNGEISNFTGISSQFEEPVNPDLRISTTQLSIDQAVQIILQKVLPKIKL